VYEELHELYEAFLFADLHCSLHGVVGIGTWYRWHMEFLLVKLHYCV
jgi:hypothetical protein